MSDVRSIIATLENDGGYQFSWLVSTSGDQHLSVRGPIDPDRTHGRFRELYECYADQIRDYIHTQVHPWIVAANESYFIVYQADGEMWIDSAVKVPVLGIVA